MKKIFPIKNFIMLELHKFDEFHLLLETTDAAKAGRGAWKVIEVGPEVKSVKVGDSIVTINGQMAQMKHEGKDIAFTSEEMVCLIIREEETKENV